MENLNYRNCNDEVTIKLIGKLTMEFPELEVNLQMCIRDRYKVEVIDSNKREKLLIINLNKLSKFRYCLLDYQSF